MNKTAYLYLRHTHDRRYEIFSEGLKRHGFRIKTGLPHNSKSDKDIFVSWNRLAAADIAAKEFEARGKRVLVAENASWGNDFQGKRWFHIAKNYHNTANCFYYNGPDRWDALNVELKPWREEGETIILPQRGIGSDPTRMSSSWPKKAVKKYGGRVRRHPGRHPESAVPFEKDLKTCGRVITWGSGAAIKALMLGIPVTSEMPNWIGEQDNTEEDRLRMFRELAWAQWTHEEIENGDCFERLL